MKNAFEKLLEKNFPELNILASGMIARLKILECSCQIYLESMHGLTTFSGALEIMKMLGLHFKCRKNYGINLNIQGITSRFFVIITLSR